MTDKPTRELVYSQSTGVLHYRKGDDTVRIGKGYSGQPPYVNDGHAEALKARGPIPRGRYRVFRPFDHVRLGPCVFYLEPKGEVYGRSGFFIHGDNSLRNQSASHGCIILDKPARLKLVEHAPIDLIVL